MGFFNNLSKAFVLGKQNTLQDPTHEIGQEELEKSLRAKDPKSIIEDPLFLVSNLGYKDNPSSIAYDTLKRMAIKNSVVAAIIQTRVSQISNFTQPARYTKDGVGYEIKLRDPHQKPTDEEKEMMVALESFLENCGYAYNPNRDDFDTFIKKCARDSLTYDQMTFEIVPDRAGRPAEIHAVDGATIRAAAKEADEDGFLHADDLENGDVQWVQVINGSVVEEFYNGELAFCIRNPRSDINIQPYGLSELEILITQITSHLWAEDYNSRYFSQGGTTKGILNLKGQNISKTQLDAFRRQWTAQLTGLTGAWKTPVVSVDGLEYINVSQSNREMEYEMWMNYLINMVSAVYQIDPSEINFPNRGGAGGKGGGLGEGGIEDRLENSKDKGLRPLLRFIESSINRHIIRRFSNKFKFTFVGLDPESENDGLASIDKSVRSFRTIDEVRAEKGLKPLQQGGDIILDPTYTNYLLQQQQQQQMAQQGSMPQDGGADEEPSADEQQQQQQDADISQSIDDNYGQQQ